MGVATKQKALSIRKLGGRIGAEISGVKLSGDMPQDIIDEIEAALVEYKVVFFRDQAHLDDSEQEAYAARFGTPAAHPFVPTHAGTAYSWSLTSEEGVRANSWHTDVTFLSAYSAISILRAVRVPDAGGDTMWANTAAAYDSMPETLQRFADMLWAKHANFGLPPTWVDQVKGERELKLKARQLEAKHPLVRVHPISGERSLILGHHWRSFVDFTTLEAFALFQLFQGYITRPENVVRWKWSVHDVAMWDNRATQHYGVGDYSNNREMHRVTINGDVPVSVDGRHSVQTLDSE